MADFRQMQWTRSRGNLLVPRRVESPPPQSGGTGPGSSLPGSGWRLLTERAFNATVEDGWTVRSGDEPNRWFIGVHDAANQNYRRLDNNALVASSVSPAIYPAPPVSGPNVGMIGFLAGQQMGSGPVLVSKTVANASGGTEIYTRMRFSFSPGFHLGYSGSSGNTKIWFTELDAGNQCILYIHGFRRETIILGVSLQNCMRGDAGVTNHMGTGGEYGEELWGNADRYGTPINPSGVDAVLVRGTHYDIESYQRANTGATTYDGVWDVFISGGAFGSTPVHIFHDEKLGYAGDDNNAGRAFGAKFNKWKLNPTWCSGTQANGADAGDPDGAPLGTNQLLSQHAPNYMIYDHAYAALRG